MSTSNFTPHNLIKEKKQSWTHLSKYHRRETIISNQIAHLTICLKNTSGTAGGPGGRDRTLAVKSRKNVRNITFFSEKNKIYPQKIFFFGIYLLVMPKCWGGNYFAHGRLPGAGQKQKTEGGKKEERERETERG